METIQFLTKNDLLQFKDDLIFEVQKLLTNNKLTPEPVYYSRNFS